MNVTKPFELSEYLKNENSHIIWRIVIANLKYYSSCLHSTDSFDAFNSYLVKYFDNLYAKLLKEEEEDSDSTDL